jgi:hypothetical protein
LCTAISVKICSFVSFKEGIRVAIDEIFMPVRSYFVPL